MSTILQTLHSAGFDINASLNQWPICTSVSSFTSQTAVRSWADSDERGLNVAKSLVMARQWQSSVARFKNSCYRVVLGQNQSKMSKI